MRGKRFLVFGAIGGALLLLFQNFTPANISAVTPAEFVGKNYVGYQAWFNTPADGTNRGWAHWGTTNPLRSDTVTVDMWPDLTEYPAASLQNTGFALGNGSPAKAFSSYPQAVIDLHFKWMQQHKIDGAFLQWFVVEPTNYRLEIAKRVKNSAVKYGRQYSIMFDISGSNELSSCNTGPKLVECVKSRWTTVVDNGIITSNYMRINGLPLVSIWGIGFKRNAHLNYTQAKTLIDWFKYQAPTKYRASVLGGVDFGWRTHTGDAIPDVNWMNTYKSLDIISPWSVGRYLNETDAIHQIRDRVKADVNFLRSNKAKYLPVIFPGFSFLNKEKMVLNQIRREGGQFMWTQARELAQLGITSTYTAMFDEIDEGTAIFKTAQTSQEAPHANYFRTVTLDIDGLKLSSDWYLKVSSTISNALKSSSLSGFSSARLPLLASAANYFDWSSGTLNPNASIGNGSVRLVYQADGNLVVLNSSGTPVWSTQTGGRSCASNCRAVFQADGNLVLYQGTTPYFATNTSGSNYKVRFSSVAPFLRVLNSAGIAVWSSSTVQPPPSEELLFSAGSLTLNANQSKEALKVRLVYQADGNLVVYNSSGAPLWASHTGGRNCATNCRAVFQGDGNLVLYQGSTAYFASNTMGSSYKLKLSGTAPHLSIINSSGAKVW